MRTARRSPAHILGSMDRKKVYLVLMGTCILLIVLAWNVVRFWSTTAAIVMTAFAAVLPPVRRGRGQLGPDPPLRVSVRCR